MKLTRKAEYAIRAVLYLSTHPDSKNILTREIADNMKIPKQFLAQVMLNLSKNGYVRAVRGAHGGFNLAKEPSEISLKDVVESVEGKMSLNDCLIADDICDNSSFCPVHEVWLSAQEKMLNVLNNADFDKLAKGLEQNKEKLENKVCI